MVVHCLQEFLAALSVSHHLFARQTTFQTSTQKNLFFSPLVVMIVLNQFLPLALSNRPPTQEGRQTSQGSASTSKRPRYNHKPVKNVDCHGGSQAQGYQKYCCYLKVVLLSVTLAQNSAASVNFAASMRGKISAKYMHTGLFFLKNQCQHVQHHVWLHAFFF